ncbi:hypothetical protein QA584_18765 [Anaerocolumna sp. AGMB13025]|uniref:hypothetical protein n=1 Tax=Anaerocolumna sp. AGMB13025 TaxID=3039116 RepID=UPI00241EFDB1|nr:hypothetical protein [Anaerocolumna sp. AGMB13025]WFR55640.1 hypothetical protein QA584_18765 [Anaerocolumna sp. AGMB13025]
MNKGFSKALICTLLIFVVSVTFFTTNTLAMSDFSTADILTLGTMYTGTLANEDDVNYYKFTTTGNDSYYKVELRNTEATDSIGLFLYSEADLTTEVYDLYASKANLDQDTRKLEANHTYYVVAKNPGYGRPTGNYKLSVTEIKDDVPDNFKGSKTLSLNKKVAYNLNADGDVDYFKFTTTSRDSYYNIELSNSEATDTISAVLYSEDDSTTEINSFSAYKAEKKAYEGKLKPNHTYYLIVKNNYYDEPIGTYKLCVKEIKDDASDTFKNCVKLSLNKKSTYNLNVYNDIDYFKIKTSKKASYTITLANKSCDNSIAATIYREDDVTQGVGTITAYQAKKDSKSITLKGNHTYYIAVYSYSDYFPAKGAYSLTVQMKK